MHDVLKKSQGRGCHHLVDSATMRARRYLEQSFVDTCADSRRRAELFLCPVNRTMTTPTRRCPGVSQTRENVSMVDITAQRIRSRVVGTGSVTALGHQVRQAVFPILLVVVRRLHYKKKDLPSHAPNQKEH